jgi:hypothetical protein
MTIRMSKIEIPLSKTKFLIGISCSIMFVVLGLYLFSTANQQTRYNPISLKLAGIAGILFFGATGIYGITKLFDKKMG